MKLNKFLYFAVISILFFAYAVTLFGQETVSKGSLKPPKNGIYVMAHRGAHKNSPENSLPAYRKAIDPGCDFVEIDTRTTKDGRIISMHNSTVDEYVNGFSGKVSEMTFDEIRSLDIGISKGKEWKGTVVPSFEEIMKLCQGKIGIYLDLKAASVPDLIKIIKQYKMERDIFWYIPADRLKEISDLKAGCPECILMPDPGEEKNLGAVIRQFNVSAIATDMGQLSESFVRTAHAENAIVIVDENKGTEAEWEEILAWHTDGIQTDDPEKLISFLIAKSQSRKDAKKLKTD
jgi:glycerophosphoryl diester phosphodiesterase